MSHETARVSPGEVVAGQYQLERILGQGGMGVVWMARDLRLNRAVAIKFLGATASNAQRERFAREAQLASRFRSPHVVHVFTDGVTSGGVPFVVMELLDGENLATHIARHGCSSLAEAADILDQVTRALSGAHAAGLVHRDIKPANIFLTPQPDGGFFVRLLDFGIAKELGVTAGDLTRSGEVLGTGYYMSPEQLRAPDQVSPATDVWALGVVLYEMLTRRLPFDAATFPSLVLCVVEGKFRAPSALRPALPAAVDHIIGRALTVEPARRYASVVELAAEFSRIARAHTSEAVIKPEVRRALEIDPATTQRTPRRNLNHHARHGERNLAWRLGYWLLLAAGFVGFIWGLATIGSDDAGPADSAAIPARPAQPSHNAKTTSPQTQHVETETGTRAAKATRTPATTTIVTQQEPVLAPPQATRAAAGHVATPPKQKRVVVVPVATEPARPVRAPASPKRTMSKPKKEHGAPRLERSFDKDTAPKGSEPKPAPTPPLTNELKYGF